MLLVLNAAEARVDILLGPDATAAADAPHYGDAPVHRCFDTPTRGTEVLAAALHALLRQQGVTAAALTRIACVDGPGSFTGIRLTLTTAAALRRVHNCTVAGCNFLQCLAVMGQRCAPDAPQFWAVTHARRNLVHVQAFAPAPPDALPAPLTATLLISPADAAARLHAAPQGTVLLGTGLARNADIAAQNPHCTLLEPSQPDAVDLWRVALYASYAHADIPPRYVRPCDAIDNLNHIAATQGMAPQHAHARLRHLLAAPVHEAE